MDWAAIEVAAGTLRFWPMAGDAEGAMVTVPDNGDPVAALRALLAPDAAMRVIAAGWPGTDAARVPCPPPAPLPAITVDPRIALHRLPGLVQDRPVDLAGTATTRIAGHLSRLPDFDGVLCLPGRATVWAHVSAGEIVSFRSFLTAELLDAVAGDTPPGDHPGFTEAVQQAMARPAGLAGDLSTLRALRVLGRLDASAAHAQAAGLLIGAELAAARPWWLGQAVTVIGNGWLAERYAQALTAQGIAPMAADPALALLDGFRAAYQRI